MEISYTETNLLVDFRSALQNAATSIMSLVSNVGFSKQLLKDVNMVNEIIEETLEEEKKQHIFSNILQQICEQFNHRRPSKTSSSTFNQKMYYLWSAAL